MKKYLEIILNSIKQSIFHKPTALAMFVLMIMVGTVACGFFSRIMIEGAEQEIYPDKPNIVGNILTIIEITEKLMQVYSMLKLLIRTKLYKLMQWKQRLKCLIVSFQILPLKADKK